MEPSGDVAASLAGEDAGAGEDWSSEGAGEGSGDGPVTTSGVATHLGRKPQSLSPARDSLIKKGLVYSAERGQIAFTVPHFGRYLLSHATE